MACKHGGCNQATSYRKCRACLEGHVFNLTQKVLELQGTVKAVEAERVQNFAADELRRLREENERLLRAVETGRRYFGYVSRHSSSEAEVIKAAEAGVRDMKGAMEYRAPHAYDLKG